MENIWDYNNSDFTNIKLRMPKPLQGGTYFSKIEHNGNPVLIQTPKCLTKNGIHKTGKKIYVDLKFSLDDKHIIEWIEKLEEKIKLLIFDKKDIWFHDEPTEDEIDYLWSNSVRTNKDSYLLRTFVQRTKDSEQIQVWDEDESEMNLDDIDNTDNLISIIEFSGLKFTSQSFCLELYLRQVVVIKDKPIFNKCLIKINKGNKVNLQLDKNIKKVEGEENDEEHQEEEIGENNKKEEEVEEIEEEKIQDNEVEETSKKEGSPVDKELEIPVKEELEDSVKEEVPVKEEQVKSNDEETEEEEINEEKTIEKNVQQIESENQIKQDVLKDINDKKDNTLAKNDKVLEEFELKIPDAVETMTLKTPRDVYLEIYKKARKKALDAKKEAIKAFLEAKKIKETYLIDQYDNDSEEEEFMEFLETEDSS